MNRTTVFSGAIGLAALIYSVATLGIVMWPAFPAEAQSVKRHIDYGITTQVRNGSSNFQCRFKFSIRIVGESAYVSYRYGQCGSTGSNTGDTSQGSVYSLSGRSKTEKYDCTASANGNTVRCTNGDVYRFNNDPSNNLDPEFRKYQVTRKHSAKYTGKQFSYSETLSHYFSAKNTSKQQKGLTIKISGNTCKVTKLVDKSSGRTSYGSYKSTSRLIGSECRIVQ